MTKWNIWRIKNRWLRAAVAWPGVILTAIGVLIFIAFGTVYFAVVGAGRRVADAYADGFGAAERKEWASVISTAWAAMTAKDEPV